MNWKTWNKTTKAKYVALAKKHRDADRFLQGKWLEENTDETNMHRGCFFGCMMQTSNNVLPTAWTTMKLPEWLVAVSETIFEGLPKKEATEFTVQLLEVIPCNKNTFQTYKDWHIWLLESQLPYCNSGTTKVVNQCIDVFRCTGEIDVDAAKSAAWSAAGSAAESAWYAARSARYARYTTVRNQRDKLLLLLQTI